VGSLVLAKVGREVVPVNIARVERLAVSDELAAVVGGEQEAAVRRERDVGEGRIRREAVLEAVLQANELDGVAGVDREHAVGGRIADREHLGGRRKAVHLDVGRRGQGKEAGDREGPQRGSPELAGHRVSRILRGAIVTRAAFVHFRTGLTPCDAVR